MGSYLTPSEGSLHVDNNSPTIPVLIHPQVSLPIVTVTHTDIESPYSPGEDPGLILAEGMGTGVGSSLIMQITTQDGRGWGEVGSM